MDPREEEQLLAALGRGLDEREPVPPEMVDIAKGLFTWRTVDAELAELTFDSATDELAGVRGTVVNRTVVFRAGAHEVEIVSTEVTERTGQPDLHLLLVHVDPVTAGMRMALRHAEGEDERLVPGHGDVAFRAVASGPVRLTLQTPDGVFTTPVVPF